MSPSEICKSLGLKSLNEAAAISGQSISVLCSWFRSDKKRFVFYAVVEKSARDKLSTEEPDRKD